MFKVYRIILGGCTELPEVRFRVETPQINKGSIDLKITKPAPEPTPTPTPKPTIKQTSLGVDEGTMYYSDSDANMLVSVESPDDAGTSFADSGGLEEVFA